MSYRPLKNLDPVPEEPFEDIESHHSNGLPSSEDESQSFLRWSRRSEIQEPSRQARKTLQTNMGRYAAALCSVVPWLISLILAVQVVVLAWKLDSMSGTSTSTTSSADLMYTLAEDAIQYRIETTYASEDYPDSEYQGWPNAEKDSLWNKYEEGNYLWIDRQTADKLPFETEHAPMPGHTDDFVVGLSVFHVLHCLSVLRRSIYPQRYNSSLVNTDGTVDYHRWHHVDHCLETVRRDVLCHADTAATTWEWIDASQMTIRPETRHVCRDFDRISEWAYERHVKANQRSHVENGKVVDYTGQPASEAWNKIQVQPPADWAYTVEDL